MTKIIFFDGYCNLCNGLIEWLSRIDKTQTIKFASLQGVSAEHLLSKDLRSYTSDIATIIYLKNGIQYDRSTAILNILADLGGFWNIAKIFLVIPKFIRDYFYVLIAKNRYRLFGKRNTCRIPTAEEKERFPLK